MAGLKIKSLDQLTGNEEELQLYENTYSLIIGIDNYPNLGFNQQLQYAVSDAKAVAKSMRENFQFNDVITLYNEQATKTNVQRELSNFRKTNKEDGVFIFFAGHGYTESTRDGDLGYIIPNDGSMNEIEMFKNISMNELTDYLKPIEAKHVFVVVDACYSGTLLATRAAKNEPATDLAYFKEMSRGRVRQVLTAGGKNQQVLDGGPGGHSVFTGYFLQYLENASSFITASQLGFKVPKQVYSVAHERGITQVPQFGNLIGEGDFVFISKNTTTSPSENGFENSASTIREQNSDSVSENNTYTIEVNYSSGKKKYEHNYNQNGNKHGPQYGYYTSGKKKYTYHYNNGLMNGDQTEYYTSGKIKYIYHFNNEQRDGVQIEYHTSGKKKSDTLYKNDNFFAGPGIDFEMAEMYDDDGTDNEDEDDDEEFDLDNTSFYYQTISSENKALNNVTRSAVGGSYHVNEKISISIAYLHLSDEDHDKNWFKSEHYLDAVGIQFGLNKAIIQEYLGSQIAFGALNTKWDTDGEFDNNYIDKQLGYFVGISLFGNWWGGESFNFSFHTIYDFNDIKNEHEELLLNGLSVGFGVQIN